MATPAHSVRSICEAVWRAERELGLLDWEVGSVRVWQALRFESFLRLAQLTEVFGPGALGDAGYRSRHEELHQAWRLARGAISHNPFTLAGPVDAIVFEGARSTPLGGARNCIHTQPLTQQLTEGGQQLLLLDEAEAGLHLKTPDPRRYYRDGIMLAAAMRARLQPVRIAADDLARAHGVERFFLAQLGVALPFAAKLGPLLASFSIEHALYKALFRLHRPRAIYCVAAYDRRLASMILAARELAIETTELQHGVISRFHLGYSYPVLPREGKLAYAADALYAWGSPWNELMRAQLSPQLWNIVAHGFTHFEQSKTRYASVPKVRGRVLVLSQTVLTEPLANAVLAALPALAGRDIVYKLHPREYAWWRRSPSLVRLSQQPNVRIVTETDLYQQMAEAEVQVGVFSTALYEGLAFGCKTALVALPGCEYVEELLEQNLAVRWETFLESCATPARSSAREPEISRQ